MHASISFIQTMTDIPALGKLWKEYYSMDFKNCVFGRKLHIILIWLMHKIYNPLDDGSVVQVIFLDVTNACDQIYDNVLLYKLETKSVSHR